MRDIFEKIYNENLWRNQESVSGSGSTMAATEAVRSFLPDIVHDYGVKTMLDIPCGDWNWFSQLWANELHLDIEKYIGADIVPAIIEANKKEYWGTLGVEFKVMDITHDLLPAVDLVMVRDLLGHFSNDQVQRALLNLRSSGSKYLLVTTFPQEAIDGDLQTGFWRPINLARLWGLPAPIHYWPEGTVDFGDHTSMKCMGLWDLRKDF